MGRGKLLRKPGKMLLEEVACNGLLAFHWGWGGGGGGAIPRVTSCYRQRQEYVLVEWATFLESKLASNLFRYFLNGELLFHKFM